MVKIFQEDKEIKIIKQSSDPNKFSRIFYVHGKREYNAIKDLFRNPNFNFIVSNRISVNKNDFPYCNYVYDFNMETLFYPSYWLSKESELAYIYHILPEL